MACRYFDEISQDTGKYCFGVEDTLQCLDMGAVETLLVWENLEVCGAPPFAPTRRVALKCCLRSQVNRHVLVNRQTDETFVKHLTPEQEKDTSHFVDKETGPCCLRMPLLRAVATLTHGDAYPRNRCRAAGVELEPQEKLSLLEWLANEYKRFGCQLECVPAALRRCAVLTVPAV